MGFFESEFCVYAKRVRGEAETARRVEVSFEIFEMALRMLKLFNATTYAI